jgi:predicted dinucleotide-binding enzyme
MKIGVLGAGNIGRTIGVAWAAAGHSVVFGVRDPGSPKTQAALEAAPSARADSVANAVEFGEVVLFAIPNAAVLETIEANAPALDQKIVIDATNRFGAPEISHVSAFLEKTPQARLFRAFNSVGWEVFARPRFGDVAPDLFYCGPGGEAGAMVEALIGDVGLRPICVGDIDRADLVDAVGALWVTLAVRQGLGRHLAFKVLA